MSGLMSRGLVARPCAPASPGPPAARRAGSRSLVAPLGQVHVLERRAAPCAGAGRLPVARRTPRRRRRRTARRRAAPRRPSVWYSSRKWPPHDSSRCSASRHISSPSSRKSATRPAFSSAWFSSASLPGHVDVAPELLAQLRDPRERLAAGPAALRAMPHLSHMSLPSSRWNESTVRLPLIAEQALRVRSSTSASTPPDTRGASASTVASLARGQVVADRVRQDEVAVGQPLHQRARAEPVGAVVGEVGLAEHVQPGDRAHQVVVHPEPAHRVVDGRDRSASAPRYGFSSVIRSYISNRLP